MLWRRERLWHAADRCLWAAVSVLFHVTVLLAVFYWPRGRLPAPAPLRVALIEGDNPFAGSLEGGTPPEQQIGEPEPEPAEQAPAEPPAREQAPPLEPARRTPPESASPPALSHKAVQPAEPAQPSPDELASLLAPGPGVGGPAEPAGAAGKKLAALVSPRRAYGNRVGEARRKALDRFGGTPGGAQAVADALAWLAAHQDANGRWDRVGFARHCPPNDRCGNRAIQRLDRNADVGITALGLLAFLGDGHLHTDAMGLYRDTTGKAVAYLVGQQQDNGQFGVPDVALRFRPDDLVQPVVKKDPLMMYNHAIATLALAEAYALTRDPKLAEPVIAGVNFLARTQQPEGGWDYWPHETHRNDTSITGWAVMALKAAASSGLPCNVLTAYRAAGHFARATEPNGSVWYADRGTGVSFDPNSGLPRFRHGPAMAAVGVFSQQLLGYRVSSPAVLAGANYLLRDPPNLAAMRGGDRSGLHSQYYWYYGTLAMFQMQGRYWAAWNPIMQKALLAAQDRSLLPDGRKAHRYGSWPAYGAGWGRNWGAEGGRIYATAINALTLEVYFRYLPLNETPADYDYTPVVEQILAAGGPPEQHALVNWLGQLRPQLAEPLLYRLLKSENPSLRFRAAIQLASYGSPLARKVIENQVNWVGPADRLAAEQALAAMGRTPVPDVFGPVLEVDGRRGLASFATGDAYVGYGLPVMAADPDGEPVARMLVASFDRQARTAVARMSQGDRGAWRKVARGQTVKLHWK